MADCPFCQRIETGEYDGRSPRYGAVTFEPLNPVTPGHRLVVPVAHVMDAIVCPVVTADVMAYAATVAREYGITSCNIITSAGPAATQTVPHFHAHIIPRTEGDGLALPWTGQQERTGHA